MLYWDDAHCPLAPIGRRVKIADLKDNIDAVKSGRNGAKGSNLAKYEDALSVLSA